MEETSLRHAYNIVYGLVNNMRILSNFLRPEVPYIIYILEMSSCHLAKIVNATSSVKHSHCNYM